MTYLLTFSRGGIVALLLVVILYVLLANVSKKILIMTVSVVMFRFDLCCRSFIQVDFNQVIIKPD